MKKMMKMTMVLENGKTFNFKQENLHSLAQAIEAVKYFEDSMNCGQSCAKYVAITLGRKTLVEVVNNGVLNTKMAVKAF